MGRKDEDEFVTYSVEVTPAALKTPTDTVKVKIKKFRGGGPRDWLKWSIEFQNLAVKKQWTDEQKGHNLVMLIDGDASATVEDLLRWSIHNNLTF